MHQNQPSRESIFLRQGERLVSRKGTHNVKFLTKKIDKKKIMLYTRAWATALKTRMLTISLRKRLQGMLHKLTSGRVDKWTN